MKTVDVYWSHQSPYCYFSLDRILRLRENPNVTVVLKPVLPGVLRNAARFSDANAMEEQYFHLDTQRTADYLSIPYSPARPNPVEFQSNTMYRAANVQPRVYELYHQTAAANEMGLGWEFLNQVSRLIWDGSEQDWHKGDLIQKALVATDIDYKTVNALALKNAQQYDLDFAKNERQMFKAGHWGVPVYVYNSEAFYGQDRFDQLLWRLNLLY